MIRGTEGYHPHGRMQAETPVNAGPSRSLELQPGDRVGRSYRPVPASATAGALAQAGVKELGFGSLPADLTTRGSGYPPESPFRGVPYSGLGSQESPANSHFQTSDGVACPAHLIRTSGIPALLRIGSRKSAG